MKKLFFIQLIWEIKALQKKLDYSKGYVWKLYPNYDILLTELRDKTIKKLSKSLGYDAEATVAFDGSKTIYTFMKSGDLDTWTMDSNGQNKTQLTH